MRARNNEDRSLLLTIDRPAEATERHAEVRIGNPGEPPIERLCLAFRKRTKGRPARPWKQRQGTLHKRQAADDVAAEELVDSLDHQRGAVLQLQRGAW